jgi:ABC-type sugar transport system ATPase subunit
MSFLVLKQLQKTYPDGTRAVHGVDLSVERGEFIVLLGPSGCGKTTTLRMVAGLELATGGTVQIEGRDVTALPPSQRDVGFVFQFYALYPHMRVRDNIAFPLLADGVATREREQRVAEVAQAVGVSSLLDRLPRQLSGGDQQRVSLARALVRRPRLWLMDEPLGTLDAAVRQSLGAFIREQQRRHGVTTLFVTHDQEEAMQLADRVVVMETGHVRQVGTPTTVYDRPANGFVAHFVGSPGMNFLSGDIRSEVFRAG